MQNPYFKYMDGSIYWKRNGKEAGSNDSRGYRKVQLQGKGMFNGPIPVEKVIDHINRIENLRLVSRAENTYNKGARGYSWNKANRKWKAQIKKEGLSTFLGYFENEEDAGEAYESAKKRIHAIE